jgi:transposase
MDSELPQVAPSPAPRMERSHVCQDFRYYVLYQRPKVMTRREGFPSAPFCDSMQSALIRGGVEMAAVAITRTDMSADDLRAAARASADAKQASRILAIAMVLEGFSREEAARLCGMDRQTLCDWVHRYNEEGLDGLGDRARSGRPPSLSWVEQGKLASWVEEGADLARDGVVRFRRADLRDRIAAEFGVTLHERSVGKLLRKLDFRHLSVRPQHPQSDPEAQEAFKKTSRT